MDLLLRPLLSVPARRAYIQTLLLGTTSLVLLFISIASYGVLYTSLIPRIGVSVPLYFTYPSIGSSVVIGPTTTVSVPDLLPQQEYSITLNLLLPTSPKNIETGNFNIHLSIPAPSSSSLLDSITPEAPDATPAIRAPLLQTTRPGILPYASPLLQTIKTLFTSPLLLVGIVKQQTKLAISLSESYTFPEAPTVASVVLEPRVEVYKANLVFEARLTGVRWVMYKFRLVAAVVAVVGFWLVQMLGVAVAWWIVGSWLGRRGEREEEERVEREVVWDGEADGDEAGLREGLGLDTGLETPRDTPRPEEEEGLIGLRTPGLSDDEHAVMVEEMEGATGRDAREAARRRRSRGE
ncbi:Similar to Seipin homolog; acc. no. O14119 [Pyronema omphalodes CBS 100304]|uniref:Similar to Seipin homolog acc. no. O14119 n=1 Tax=Pyronema omphalodes (strain CBS 100304) TaxID=1076935 RepID=U4L6F1_PYROM|nr:Similar to Seipin homolog; acc. no. O14119 [Pyronema omphalodes CBS 100304]